MTFRVFFKGAIIAAAMIFFFAIFTLPAGASDGTRGTCDTLTTISR